MFCICNKTFSSISGLEAWVIKHLVPYEYKHSKNCLAYFRENRQWWFGYFCDIHGCDPTFSNLGAGWRIDVDNGDSKYIGTGEFLVCLYDRKRQSELFLLDE